MPLSTPSEPPHPGRNREPRLGAVLLWMAVVLMPTAFLGALLLNHSVPMLLEDDRRGAAIALVLCVIVSFVISLLGYFFSRQRAVEQAHLNLLNAERQGQLFALSMSLKRAQDEIEVGEAVVDSVTQILMVERASFSLLRDGRARLVALKSYNAPPDTPVSGEYVIDVDRGVIGDAIHTGSTLRATNPDPERVPLDQSLNQVTRDIVVMPILMEDKVVGAIEASNPMHGGSFSEDDVHSVEHVARAAGISLATVSAYERNRAQTERLIDLIIEVLERHSVWPDHTRRVEHLTAQVGRSVGLLGEELESLRLAARLHDIGLASDDVEDPAHPVEGARMVAATELPASVGSIIGAHHERMDGTGFPRGLTRSEIPMGARVLAAIEAFENWTNPKSPSYKGNIVEFRAHATRDPGLDQEVLGHLFGILDLEQVD